MTSLEVEDEKWLSYQSASEAGSRPKLSLFSVGIVPFPVPVVPYL